MTDDPVEAWSPADPRPPAGEGTVRTEQRTLRVNGIEMNVVLAGEGPDVLLVHGFPDTHRVWRKIFPALVAAGYRVIMPDTRGRGATQMPPRVSDYHIDELTKDLVGLLDALGIGKVHLVGHDWGAIQAWFLAMRHPERVEQLLAMSVGHPSAYAVGGLMQKLKGWYVLLFQLEGFAERCVTALDWLAFRLFANLPEEYPLWRAELARPGRLSAGMNYYRANIGIMLGHRPLPSVTVPVRGMFSTGDRYLTERQMRLSAGHVQGAFAYDRLDGVGHWMQISDPETVTELLLKRLQQK